MRPLALFRLEIHDSGMVANHNFPCPVCLNREAVYCLNDGKFEPCWGCQKDGWELKKKWSPKDLFKPFIDALPTNPLRNTENI